MATEFEILTRMVPTIQPVIVRADLDAESKARAASALLTLHERHALEPFGFTRFVAPDAALYV